MPIFTGTALPELLYGSAMADTLTGLGSDDVLYGFDANDLMDGGAGDDLLFGGSGNDTLIGGAGEDLFWGQSGNDLVSYISSTNGLTLNLVDTTLSTGDALGDFFTSVEQFQLSNYDDILIGGAKGDQVDGAGGNDTLWGYEGHDWLSGGDGNDCLIGGFGNDTLSGGVGFDIVSYADNVLGLRIDLLAPSTATDEAAGDVFVSIEGFVLGSGGDMAILLSAAEVWGRLGDDTLTGGSFDDTLHGDTGVDLLTGGGGNDALFAGDEDNPTQLMEDFPNAVGGLLFGEAGHDSLTGSNIRDLLDGGIGNDVLFGAAADDTLKGDLGLDRLYGGDGNDCLYGGASGDVLDGGSGLDTVVYENTVLLNLSDPARSTGDARGDFLTSVETILLQGRGSTYIGSSAAMIIEVQNIICRVRPGAGSETILGNGVDTAVDYGLATSTVRLVSDTTGLTGGIGAAMGDRLEGITTLTLSRFSDSITLNGTLPGLEQVLGGNGRDSIVCASAFSDVDGGAANDTIKGSLGDGTAQQTVMIEGGIGDDVISLTAATATSDLTLLGGDGIDRLTLTRSDSEIYGGNQNDVITATGQNLILSGDAGDDLITFRISRDAGVLGEMNGGAGNDVLIATAANTGFSGGAGIVTLIGGAGNDSMTGSQHGSGSALHDHFVFSEGWGQDSVLGFEDGFDLLSFVGTSGLANFADLIVTGSAFGTTVAFGSDSVFLQGFNIANFTDADVLFT